MCRAVFLDRDGTLILERNYLRDPSEVEIFPGAAPALLRLRGHGFKLFIVSNQSGVGRGILTLAEVNRVNDHLSELFRTEGVTFDAIYVAPEAPGAPSRGRKPSPQFLFDARDAFNLDLARSYVIGDKLIDLQCGWNAGIAASLLVRTGYGGQVERECADQLGRAVIVDGVGEATDWILSPKRTGQTGRTSPNNAA